MTDKIPPLNSTELLLLAHDEWKNREERKYARPEHCEHECVCCNFPDDVVSKQRCPRRDCKHDTRLHPMEERCWIRGWISAVGLGNDYLRERLAVIRKGAKDMDEKVRK
jgi:hypothetical protein